MKVIGHTPFYEAQTDLEDAQIAAVSTIYHSTQAIPNGTGTSGNEPDIKQSDG